MRVQRNLLGDIHLKVMKALMDLLDSPQTDETELLDPQLQH